MKLILFNVCFVAVLACLIKPSLLSRYTSTIPSRWWFALALIGLAAISPYKAAPPQASPAALVQPSAATDTIPTAAAVQESTAEAAAAAPKW